MATKKNDSNKPVKYKGYTLTTTRNDKGVSIVFSGKAIKEFMVNSYSDQNDVISELKKRIDDNERRFTNPENKESAQNDTLSDENQSKKLMTLQIRDTLQLPSNNSEHSDIGNANKREVEVGVEKNNNQVTEPNNISSFEKSLNILIKDVEKINKSLDKPQPSIASQNDILDKISYLTKVSNANKSDLDQLRKDYTEKSQIQEKLLRDILTKINAVAQADHVTEHLTSLHTRLDNKIDLQDAEQILSLKTKIEASVNTQLITSVSKKIMPVVDILKRQVDGFDTTFSKSVDDLEQRCGQAGLIPIDKLF